jgi:hypothetical protein
MRMMRILFTALGAVIALGVAASAASAAEIYVNSKSLKAKPAELIGGVLYAAETEGIAENVPITSGYLEVAGKTKVVCLKLHVIKGLIKAPNTGTIQEAIFSSCAETLNTRCSLASSTIAFVPLKGTVSALASPKAEIRLEPKEGTKLAEIAYSATNPSPCYKATETLTGLFTIVLPEGQTELSPQPATVNSVAGELELNSEAAFEHVGGGEASIVSGHTFSFH